MANVTLDPNQTHAEINSMTKQKSRWVIGVILTLIMSATQLRCVIRLWHIHDNFHSHYTNSTDYSQITVVHWRILRHAYGRSGHVVIDMTLKRYLNMFQLALPQNMKHFKLVVSQCNQKILGTACGVVWHYEIQIIVVYRQMLCTTFINHTIINSKNHTNTARKVKLFTHSFHLTSYFIEVTFWFEDTQWSRDTLLRCLLWWIHRFRDHTFS